MSPTCPGSIWCQRESSVLTLKNDLSQQDLEGGRCVWQPPAPCWQPNRVEEESIIRITHTNIQIHTSSHKYSCTEYSYTLHQTCEIVCMPACTEKRKKTSLDWYFLPQTEHDVVAVVMSEWQAHWQSQTRLNTTKTDRKKPITWHTTS